MSSGVEPDDRFEAACEGAYEAARTLWLSVGRDSHAYTAERLAEAHAEILRAVEVAEEVGLVEVERDRDGAVTVIRAVP